MKHPTVSAGIARSMIDYAETRGIPRARMFEAVGLVEADLSDQDARVALATYREIIEVAKRGTGDGAFVLNHAIDTELSDMSVVGLIVHSSASMADAMTELNRYARLMVEVDVMEGGERFTVQPDESGVWIVDNRPDPNAFPELSEAAFARFESEFRREFPDRPFARAVEVTHDAPAYAEAYERILRCPVTFGATRNALCIAPEWLTQEFDAHSGYVFGIFAEKADALLAELEASDSLIARIEGWALPNLHRGALDAETAARDMGMSRQTLYRRLKDEGETFAGVLDGLRFRMAREYLAARKVSVNETAYLVGFSEASSFVRAFKRWSGQTPSAFRATPERGDVA